jgi:hypothetical protein
MVARCDDGERDERRIERTERPNPLRTRNGRDGKAYDSGVADVQAWDCCIRVVERADKALVEIDVATGDCVVKADPGDARWCRREGEKGGECGERAEDEDRSNPREVLRASLMKPEQQTGCNKQVKAQIRPRQ